MNQKHIGSDFDDFLREEGLLDVSEAAAIKRVIAFQVEQEMKARGISKSEMAGRMKTSRAAVERLLDPANTSVTLSTLGRAASALDRRLRVQFTEPTAIEVSNRVQSLAATKTRQRGQSINRAKRRQSQ
jgi:antitoxin HicB